jgi:hypothetical protein
MFDRWGNKAMNDALQNHVEDVYKKTSTIVRTATTKNPTKASLILIGEEHTDADKESQKKPALNGAIVELSLLKKAKMEADASGRELVICVERESIYQAPNDPSTLKKIREAPYCSAAVMAWAMENNVRMVAADTQRKELDFSSEQKLLETLVTKNPKREQGMIDTINNVAVSAEKEGRKPPIVVGIFGAGHLSGLMEKSEEKPIDLQQQKSTLEKTYGSVTVINTAYFTDNEVKELEADAANAKSEAQKKHALMIKNEYNFYTNENNGIIQFVPPELNIGFDVQKRVEAASQKLETNKNQDLSFLRNEIEKLNLSSTSFHHKSVEVGGTVAASPSGAKTSTSERYV